jgi:DoxX-like family
MSQKAIKIIGWVLTGILAFIFLGSSYSKLIGSDETIKSAAQWGLTASSLRIMGTIELLSIILFAIPRTGLLGTLLLVAYMGGAIAIHLTHALSVMAPCAIASLLWITATVRFPELRQRLFGTTGKELHQS